MFSHLLIKIAQFIRKIFYTFLDISGILLGVFFELAWVLDFKWTYCGRLARNGNFSYRYRGRYPSHRPLFFFEAHPLVIRLRRLLSSEVANS